MPNGKNNTASGEAGSVIKAVLLISAVIMAVFLIVGGIYLAGIYHPQKDTGADSPEAGKYFSELIAKETEAEVLYEDMELSREIFEESFILYETREAYYQECKVTFSDKSGESLERNKRILRDGEKFNIRTYNKNTLTETIKCDGENILIVNEITGERNQISADGQSLYSLAGLPDHATVLSLVEEYAAAEDKSTARLTKCSSSLTRTREENILTLSITYRDSGVSEKYRYYLDSGIIYHCESSVALGGVETIPYTMTTTYFETDIADFLTEDSFLVGNK